VLFARLLIGMLAGYGVLMVLVWLFQERLAFPAPHAPLPDPVRAGLPDVERVSLVMKDGTPLAGWYLPAAHGTGGGEKVAALLWFYGNGENIAAIWPVLRDFRPPGVALLVVDYPGYGASGGRASEDGLYEAADLAYQSLVDRPEVDRARIFVYGRSLGSAVATNLASTRSVAGLVLESPFTSARDMSRRHYALFPTFILRLRLDNLAALPRVRCPVLVFHGTADRLVPPEMGRRVAAAAPGPSELVLIEGAGHNDTYDLGGRAYRDKLWAFIK
jgi:fermentation-respiration switch protein FrsA (DUF1100 family)